MLSRALALSLAAVGFTVSLSARQAPAIPPGLVEKYTAASETERAALTEQFPVIREGPFRIELQRFGGAKDKGGDLTTAVRAFEAAIVLAQREKSPRGEASALLGLTAAYGPRGYYDEAIAALEAASKLVEPLNDSEMLASIANNLGNIYRRRGEPDLALEQFGRALALHEADGRVDAAARTLNNIGIVYQDQYNGRLALDFFLRSLALKEKVSTPADQASTLNSIGNQYLLQNDLVLALEYHTRALAIFEKNNSVRSVVTSLTDIGLVHLNAGRLDEAEAALLRALPISEQAKVPVGQAQILANLGTISIERRRFDEARSRLEKSAAIFESAGARVSAGESLIELGRLEKELGRLDAAMARTVEARERLEASGTPISLAGVFYQEGELHQLMKHPDLAIKSYERATELMERIRGLVAGDTEDRVRFFEDRVDPYYNLADVYAASGRAADAFRTVERARSRGLLEVLGGAKSGDGLLTPAELARQRELENTMVSLTQRLNFQRTTGGEGGAPIRELEAEVARVKSTRDAFSLGLDQSHPELKFVRGEGTIVDVETLAATLPERTALIEYSAGQAYSWAFLVTGRGTLRMTKLAANAARINDLSTTFAKQLASRDLAFARTARELYDALLGPIDDRLTNIDHLIVVPHGTLWQVPFQALQTPRRQYLIEERAISYAPSASALKELIARHKPQPANPRLLAFGDPGTATLPNAAREVKELATLYGAQAVMATAGEATERRFREQASQADIVHLATHGIMDDASPLFSHVVLAKSGSGADADGRLEGRELLNMRLKADLVVLSACETARGHAANGEGMLGMSWALFAAGASTAAVSLWKVDSASTTDLMTAFHRGRRQAPKGTAPTAQAMRAAQRALLAKPEYRHPFYWAGFVVVGVP